MTKGIPKNHTTSANKPYKLTAKQIEQVAEVRLETDIHTARMVELYFAGRIESLSGIKSDYQARVSRILGTST